MLENYSKCEESWIIAMPNWFVPISCFVLTILLGIRLAYYNVKYMRHKGMFKPKRKPWYYYAVKRQLEEQKLVAIKDLKRTINDGFGDNCPKKDS